MDTTDRGLSVPPRRMASRLRVWRAEERLGRNPAPSAKYGGTNAARGGRKHLKLTRRQLISKVRGRLCRGGGLAGVAMPHMGCTKCPARSLCPNSRENEACRVQRRQEGSPGKMRGHSRPHDGLGAHWGWWRKLGGRRGQHPETGKAHDHPQSG